jgi:hypothetical protein
MAAITNKKSEALSCFTYLVENTPLWIKSLDELQSRVQSRQAEVSRVAVPVVRKIKKTSSNESIRRSGHETSSPSTGLEMTSAPQAYDIQQATVAAKQITPSRRRKTVSLISAASGIHKYRSRASITVYYDSEVEEAFDRLVRNISSGRNSIRKSRMADRVASLTSMHSAANNASNLSQNRMPMLRTVRSASGMPRFDAYIEESLRLRGRVEGLRPPPPPMPIPQDTTLAKSDNAVQQPTDAREEADAALDRAQGFCERGAHQLLRDGDCSEEVAGAKAAFEEVIKISQLEVERLQKEAAIAAEKAEAERAGQEKLEQEKDETENKQEQMDSINQHPALMQAAMLIEADDDEEASGEDYDDPSLLPSPPFRLMART